ncbi:MAG: glycosyltransferase family 4 protein [Candidatus Magasanikbacteria bacterium]|nr:glycosyltransferase family 4 protein [Candidatus Magasanikbacteria bacterium]
MKILQANKFYYYRGGAEKVFFDTIFGLREKGNEVQEFSMNHLQNLPSPYSKYFISEVDLMGGKNWWHNFWHLFNSSEVNTRLNLLFKEKGKPEVAHLHNVYHQLSATIFKKLKRAKIPTVLTVHDVQPMCPNHRMIRNNQLCERCHKHKYYQCVFGRCVDGSFIKSKVAAFEAYYYWIKGIYQGVDVFITPSNFFKEKMIAWGFPEYKIRVVRNPYALPVQTSPLAGQAPALGNKILYLGRLHTEKGIKFFMESLLQLKDLPVIIAGNGPEEKWVEEFIKKHDLKNVEMAGWVADNKWEEIIKQAKVVVVPSLFFENCSISILEAMGYGRLVVATDRGGNNELIIDGKTGFLVVPEDSDALAFGIKKAFNLSESQGNEIIKNAKELIIKNHDPKKYIDSLENIYKELI